MSNSYKEISCLWLSWIWIFSGHLTFDSVEYPAPEIVWSDYPMGTGQKADPPYPYNHIKFTQPQIYMMSQESCSFLWCDYIKMEKTFWTYLNFRSQNWTQRILISRCAESREPTSNITLREKSNKKENWGKRERNDW